MPPKLSIITPSFNQGAFLERTIRSVLDQGYPNLEYVIVDGGSSDESVEIIKRYEDRLAWWVSEPDEGQTQAINKGIERTSGEIVAYINSDDYYLPGAFEKAIAAFESTGASWVAGGAVDVNEEPPHERVRTLEPTPPSSVEGPFKGRHWWMLAPWCTPQPSTFWRRELFERYGLFRLDMHYAFDAEFMLRSAYGGDLPGLLPGECLSTRSVHPAQKSNDLGLWKPEFKHLTEIYRTQLTPREQRLLPIARALAAVYFPLRDHVIVPVFEFLGDLLEYVPERWRPKIRTRDRIARPE